MKQTIKLTVALLFALLMLLGTVSCEQTTVDTEALWKNAIYAEDTTLGEGKNTVTVEIGAGERSVTLTIKTDKSTLGEALYENGLINDPSFFDVCNGITADWNKDAAYWAFHVDGKLADYGVADAKAVTADAPAYELIYTK